MAPSAVVRESGEQAAWQAAGVVQCRYQPARCGEKVSSAVLAGRAGRQGVVAVVPVEAGEVACVARAGRWQAVWQAAGQAAESPVPQRRQVRRQGAGVRSGMVGKI